MHCLCQLSYLLPTAESSDHPSPNFAQEIPLMQHGQPQSDQAVGLGGRYKPPQIKYFILLYSKPFPCSFHRGVLPSFPIQFILGWIVTLAHWQTWQCRSMVMWARARSTFQHWEDPESHTTAPAGRREAQARTLLARQRLWQIHFPGAYELANYGFWIRLGLNKSCAVRYTSVSGILRHPGFCFAPVTSVFQKEYSFFLILENIVTVVLLPQQYAIG